MTGAEIHSRHNYLNTQVLNLWSELCCGFPDVRSHEEIIKVANDYQYALLELIKLRETYYKEF